MNTWNPEQQITHLKLGAYTALLASGMFASELAAAILFQLHVQWAILALNVMLTIAVLTLITAFILEIKGGASDGLRAFFRSYSEEYAKEVSRKANTHSFYTLLVLLALGYLVGDADIIVKPQTFIAQMISLHNMMLLMLALTFLVWGWSVLAHLRDEVDC